MLRFWFDRGAAGVRIDSAALAMKHPDLPEVDPRPRSRRPPVRGSRRAARPLPVWRAIADAYHPAAGADRRAVAGGPRALRPLPAGRRTAHRVQLRLPRLPVGAGGAAPLHRRHPRRPCARRGAGDVGALQPRRHPGRHPLRPRATRRSRSAPSASAPRRTARSASAAPGPPPCWRWRCRAASTCTRATSSACPRSRTCPSIASRTRCTSSRAASTPAATAAACRCRGRAPRRRTASARTGARAEPWLPQPADWAPLTAAAQRRQPGSMLELYRRALRLRREHLAGPDEQVALAPGRRRRAGVPPRRGRVRRQPHRRPAAAAVARAGAGGQRRTGRRSAARRRRGVDPRPRELPDSTPAQRRQGAAMNTRRPNSRRRGRAMAAALAAVLVVTACGDDDDDASGDTDAAATRRRDERRHRAGGTGEKVTITVSNLPPATEEETREAFLTRVEEFEAANPDIDIEPSEYEWDVATFAAQMAGGTLPTTFQIPFPDTRGLVERGQVADVTEQVNALPYAERLQPQRARRHPGRRGTHLRRADRGLRHRPALQPHDVRGGRARSRRATDDVGRGARVRQADRRRHRAGRLRPALPEQHRRLDAHRADLRQRWAHAGGHR